MKRAASSGADSGWWHLVRWSTAALDRAGLGGDRTGVDVESLLAALSVLWRESGDGKELRLSGGLAVRLHVGSDARVTRDIDVVAMTAAARGRLLSHLEQTGWAVGASGGWWRASRAGASRLILDIASHPVINPRTFDGISLSSRPWHKEIGGVIISVAEVSDLVTLKLMAMRDQDLVDLVLLAGRGLSAGQIARNADVDDIERPLSAGANQARHALRSGLVRDVFEQTLGRPPEEEALANLEVFLDELEKKGI